MTRGRGYLFKPGDRRCNQGCLIDMLRELPDREELKDVWPLEFEVVKVKPVQTADTSGVHGPQWKLRLEPSWDGTSAFWTNEMDELIALPGDLLELDPTGRTQSSISEAAE